MKHRSSRRKRRFDGFFRESSENDPSQSRKKAHIKQLAQAAAAILIVGAPQLLGGVLGWTTNVIAIVAGLALVAAWARYLQLKRHDAPSPAMIFFALAVVWTGLQLFPLPCSWIAGIAPRAVHEYRSTAELLQRANPRWCAITADPANTRTELIKWCAALAAFLSAWLLSASGHRRFILGCVAASTGVMAFVALGHRLLEVPRVFGLYTPLHANPQTLAPLLNDNNLAGFLAMGLPIVVGFSLTTERRAAKVAIFALAALIVSVALSTLSKGGFGALVGGLIFFFLVGGLKRGLRVAGREVGLPVVAAVAFIFASGSYAMIKNIAGQFQAEPLWLKPELAVAALKFGLSQPWPGVGRGAFASAFPRYRGAAVRFEYPENIVAQWAVEWGLPFAMLGFAVLTWTFATGVRRARRWPEVGAAAGLFAIALHNLVDFGLELTGVLVVAASLLGALDAPARTKRSEPVTLPKRPSWLTMRSTFFFAVGASTASLAFFGAAAVSSSVKDCYDSLLDDVQANKSDLFRKDLVRSLDLHPTEPIFPLLAAMEELRQNHPRALVWLNRAMELAPGWYSPHSYAAWWLIRNSRTDQAMLEVREVAYRNPIAGAAALCKLLPKADLELVLKATPEAGQNRVKFLNAVVPCLKGDTQIGDQIDGILVRRAPTMFEPRLRRAERRLARPETVASALAEANAAIRIAPNRSEGYLLLSRALSMTGRARDGLTILQRVRGIVDSPRVVAERIASVFAALGDEQQMRRAIDDLQLLSRDSPEQLASSMVLLGTLESQLGNAGRALGAFEDANRIIPNAPALHGVISAAHNLGNFAREESARADLCEQYPDHPLAQTTCVSRKRVNNSPEPMAHPTSIDVQ